MQRGSPQWSFRLWTQNELPIIFIYQKPFLPICVTLGKSANSKHKSWQLVTLRLSIITFNTSYLKKIFNTEINTNAKKELQSLKKVMKSHSRTKLVPEERKKSKKAGLRESQSRIHVGKLTIWVRSFEMDQVTRSICSTRIG